MKIEVGKYYRDAVGLKRGPMMEFDKIGTMFHEGDKSPSLWNLDGSPTYNNSVSPQIIAEWTETLAATPETGTLRELNVQPGDVVENQKSKCRYIVAPDMTVGGPHMNSCIDDYKIISRSSRAAPPSPVITETVTTTTQRIGRGQYGRLAIAGACSDCVELEFTGEYGPTGRTRLTRAELTAAIATLTQIRDALK